MGLALPRTLGYRMPAEWEPHASTWMVWPQNRTDWPGKFAPITWVYADILRHLSRVETVHIILNDAGIENEARRALTKSGVDLTGVRFHQWPTNRGWTRDSGPIFVTKATASREVGSHPVAVTNWGFNAWAKYKNWPLDDRVPHSVAAALGLPEWTPEMDGKRLVLEGGSIDVNGEGLLLTTEECLLSEVQQRNPGVGRTYLEAAFRDYLGIEKVIWLGRGIEGDDTHGHIDDIARFTSADTVVAAVETDTSDANYEPLRENLARLRAATDTCGNWLRIVELPMPQPVIFDGRRLPASYANFYIANGIVLVPTFNDPRDRIALGILADVFPDRQVIGIHSRDLIWGLGAVHCMTQQQPA
ncbi:MAG: agmatine/peptidylarginine deiminase [Capsulimonadaceae bacterium]